MTTVTALPTLMPSSSTASLVIEEVTMLPPISTRTWEVVAPFLTSTTVPLIWLRALAHIGLSHVLRRSRRGRARRYGLKEEELGTVVPK